MENNEEVRQVSRTYGKVSQPSSTISGSSLQFAVSSVSNEWYTPARYVEAVREVFGGKIELDPASSKEANAIVRAENIYTVSDNGLAKPWNAATLFLNPPYGRINGKSQAGVWAHRLISEYNAGNVREAVLLVNACTSEKWFEPLFTFPICFSNRRISFNGSNGKGCSPTKGSSFIYFGKNPGRFASAFEAHNLGTVISRYRFLSCTDDIATPELFLSNSERSAENCSALDELPDGRPAGEEAAESA